MICDHAAQFDIRKLAKPGCHLPDRFEFADGVLETTWTSSNFGGRRQWFLCPSCDRRCAIIYCHPKTLKMGCRVCLKGRYASEYMSPQGRRLHAAFAVRRRLGQKKGGIGPPFPLKPKGMHWRTYQAIRVAALHEELNIWFQGYADISNISVEKAKQRFSKHL
ncbi:hypothetical protein DFP92_11843 [Yoonia sediminilitoris]|uniref:Uncharacterized protein n=1 Tax=Yoonia sediminilitoris TaxID=1286148 RepID=A0A2T6K745_9RHOB|nr:hypothetical protein C8N45_1181 [Yoonia sediminilitoris]RCW90098.1 hypothetical protein DFP92_11843 [Yoonia sediminilitoris]